MNRREERRAFEIEGMLESALATPFQSLGGTDAYPSIQQKTARMCFGLVMNHPFVDGNKRIGTHVMLVFLMLNDIELAYQQDELADIILRLASGEITYDALLQWLIVHQG